MTAFEREECPYMVSENKAKQIDRRQFMRRAAVAGAAAAWTAPVVKTIVGTPAFAQEAAGSPKDLSYVVVFYTYPESPGQCAIKWDIDSGSVETGDFALPLCGDRSGGQCGDASHFNFSANGASAQVCPSEAGIALGVVLGGGVAKCGNDSSTGCVGGVQSGNCLVFTGCGV
jgi:hypothetical protein